jgi:citrate synthase
MQAILPFAAAADPMAFDTGADHLIASGASILHLLAAAATGRVPGSAAAVAETLATGWRVHDEQHRRLIDMALILCADHELNVSAFAARVVASALSTPYDVVSAGLAALRGPLHGGHTSRLETLFDEAGTPAGLRGLIASQLRPGEPVPGFGHRLYPRGDPRARVLMSAVQRRWPRSDAAAFVAAARRIGRTLVGEQPTIDMALVILRRALKLPGDSALVLFALGRTAGWLAHAMEQYAAHQLIRPRASYVGVPPR